MKSVTLAILPTVEAIRDQAILEENGIRAEVVPYYKAPSFYVGDNQVSELLVMDFDADKAREILEKLIQEDERILKDPAPFIRLSELADSSVNFVVRMWVNRPDYWAVKFDMTRGIKEAFDAAGIEIPFPQRTIHHVNAA